MRAVCLSEVIALQVEDHVFKSVGSPIPRGCNWQLCVLPKLLYSLDRPLFRLNPLYAGVNCTPF